MTYGSPRLNELAELMKFYETQGIGGNVRGARGPDGKNPFDVRGMAADWAAQQMGGGMGGEAPDFFGGRQPQQRPEPAYVRPERFQGQRPQTQGANPQVMNYLAQLMGRR
jgi:hypothetical protein